MDIIDYQNVEIRQEDMFVLGDVTFTVGEGDFVYLIGKVGSGKSSLLKTMYGELDPFCTPANSHAIVLGMDMTKLRKKLIPKLRRQMGIVFQDFQLLTDRNVFDNLNFVLMATGWKDKKMMHQQIMQVLDLVGMDTKGYKMPHELSGGEQQRICIARALLNNPKLILADEPTGNLDTETGRQIMQILKKVNESGTTIIMITHNTQWIDEYPGYVFRCEDRKLVTDQNTAEEQNTNEDQDITKETSTVDTLRENG